ncbi:MAG: ThiF family adenylyltransferase [Acidihalobacter sp.]|uniref:ThiF family adenylyltransferase n=1 Tax=Acidihalobacter sp. TaxID=1872108 RepID=UPI00307FB7D2
MNFDYDEAFSRTIGWITRGERELLKGRCVAVAGLGGVGGSHVMTLARLGIQRFNLADMDSFALVNMNRQAGAFCSTMGEPKLDVITRMARDINPGAEVQGFPEGVSKENLGRFLDGADLYVDGLDFFEMNIRRAVFAACRERGIPALTAAPLGVGVALLAFDPQGMSFEDYFDLEGRTFDEQLLRFMVGLAPRVLQQTYVADPSAVSFSERRGPSTPMACELCAGVAGAEAMKLLLGRGRVSYAPSGLQFDAYRQKMVRTWRPGGNRNPLQRLILAIAGRRLKKMAT